MEVGDESFADGFRIEQVVFIKTRGKNLQNLYGEVRNIGAN